MYSTARKRVCSLLALLALPMVAVVQAQEHRPRVCTGVIPTTERYLLGSSPYHDLRNCPPHHALYAVNPVLKKRFRWLIFWDDFGREIAVEGNCCPLPAEDILTGAHSYSAIECPSDSVATGTRSTQEFDCSGLADSECLRLYAEVPQELRCTKINTERYALESATAFHVSAAAHLSEYQDDSIFRAQVPLGIRYALGRYATEGWLQSTCVGYPWGSLFAGKHSKLCNGLSFRTLVYRGLGGDPAAGTPVGMFPKCIAVEGVLSGSPICQIAQGAPEASSKENLVPTPGVD